MSIKVMTQVWDLQLPHADKLLLLALADNANDEGLCWPSVATLGRKTGMDPRTVQRVIGRLAEAGHVTVRTRPNQSNDYLLHPKGTPGTAPPPGSVPPPAERLPPPAQRRGPGGTTPGDPRQAAAPSRHSAGGTPGTAPPKSSSEPSGIPHGTSERAGARGPTKVGGEDPEPIRVARALQLLEQLPDTPLGDLARMFRTTAGAIRDALEARNTGEASP